MDHNMIKKNRAANGDASGATSDQGDQPQFRDNPQVNAKIDAYIEANPKHWQYIQSMPPERMARALVLNEVSKEERQQRMREGIMKKLDQDPEMKAAYETLVKNLPEDQREKMMTKLAAQTMRSVAPREPRQAHQSGVKV
jgi:hypothetical protein